MQHLSGGEASLTLARAELDALTEEARGGIHHRFSKDASGLHYAILLGGDVFSITAKKRAGPSKP